MFATPDFLPAWMVKQRWFAGKGREPDFEVIGRLRLESDADVDITVLLVLDRAENPLLYQVPITERSARLPGGDRALIARTPGGGYVYDGPHDPSFAEAFMQLMLEERTVRSGAASKDDGRIVAFGHSDTRDDLRVRASRVLSGEQSNTSIIIETQDSSGAQALPVICKLFRTVHDGENPDVVLTTALADAGSRVVPQPVGHITGRWADTGTIDGLATGHLAFAQEFLRGNGDAWRNALAAIDGNDDFGDRAEALGRATAEMHGTLATAMPSHPASREEISLIVAAMRARFAASSREVPQLDDYKDRVDAIYSAAEQSEWPRMQRIHGDYHLGQVLSVPGRGWVLLDFEGEPLRLMRERSAPDSPIRDVAAMLRSFDYAAGSYTRSHPNRDARAWAEHCRERFLAGYNTGNEDTGLAERQALITAFEVDKAVYEAMYETRNRPEWLGIPLEGVERLVGPTSVSAEQDWPTSEDLGKLF